MDECLHVLTQEPVECLEMWKAAPGAYADALDTTRSIDPHCGVCIFAMCACCPLNPCSLIPAVLLEGCAPSVWLTYLCCPWLVTLKGSSREKDDMV